VGIQARKKSPLGGLVLNISAHESIEDELEEFNGRAITGPLVRSSAAGNRVTVPDTGRSTRQNIRTALSVLFFDGLGEIFRRHAGHDSKVQLAADNF